jgi:hypothetical protein
LGIYFVFITEISWLLHCDPFGSPGRARCRCRYVSLRRV